MRSRRSWVALLAWLRRRPVLWLLALTPGIPEYLSGSSSLEPLVTHPLVFPLLLGLNLALYGPGVLLVREAMIRWRKGWATAIALGAAYAIVEEGLAVDTFFYPRAGPVGALGSYGHWLGVSWVWVTGIVMVHVVYSLCLPIALLGLAFPETNGRSLVGRRGIAIAFLVLGADVVLLEALVSRSYGFFFGWPLAAGSLVAVAGLVFLGRWLPRETIGRSAGPARGPRALLMLVGLGLLPGTFVIEGAHGTATWSPALTIALLVAFYAALLWLARRALGASPNPRGVVAFAAGALVPIMAFGIVAELALPVVLGADAAAVAFLCYLWRKYPDRSPSALGSDGVGASPRPEGGEPEALIRA